VRLDALAKSVIDGKRFFLVDYLPTYAAALLLATLVWAGAPGPLEAGRAWRTAADLGIGELVLATLALTLVAVLLHPFQLGLVRLLEGEWPEFLAPVTHWSRRRQAAALRRLAEIEKLPDDSEAAVSDARVQEAGRAGAQRRVRFPTEELCRPTAVGNVLAATEARAGSAYGFDAVVAWPRLYPVLGTQMRAIVDDRRDTLDVAARLTVTMLMTGLIAAALLAFSGWSLLLALIPLALSWIASRATMQAAMAYGEAVDVAFDLHRFDLLSALRLPLPVDDESERLANAKLCDSWRQGLENTTTFQHSAVPPPASSA
jgi:hypothetical protein